MPTTYKGLNVLPLTADHIGKQGGNFEPQRSNNGRLIISGVPGLPAGDDVLTLSLQGFTVPKVASNVLTIGYYNEVRKFAGNPIYEGLTVSYHDYVDRDTAFMLWQWRLQVHDPRTGATGLASVYKKAATIELFAPNGTKVRAYALQGLWLTSMDPGDINMTSDEPLMINCGMEVDKWYPTFAGVDEGAPVSGTAIRV